MQHAMLGWQELWIQLITDNQPHSSYVWQKVKRSRRDYLRHSNSPDSYRLDFMWQDIWIKLIRGWLKKKNTIIWGKSPKGGGGQGQNQKSLHLKCRLFCLRGGGLNFSDFPQIQIIEIWPWVLWYMGLILVRYMQHLEHRWPMYE